ncbi:MAG: MATE family efflux transporter [Gorillibacterium sp.]|nr:MATE family efflux transporter [Gorillibacterium sp.]
MKQTFSVYQKSRQLLLILLPILVSQIALFGMSFFDTVMSGHFSSNSLAGVAIGASIWTPVQTGLSGILLAITPIVAQHIGAGRKDKVANEVTQGIYFALVLAAAVITAGFFLIDPILSAIHLEPEVYVVAHRYLVAMSFGIVPLFIYTVLRCFIDALGQTHITMGISLLALPVNIVLNYILVFGKLGFKEMGGPGSGVASALTFWWILFITVWVIMRKPLFEPFRLFKRVFKVSFHRWKELVQIGLPTGFAIFFETSIFAAVTMLMSQYSTVTIAAHQAAINFASLLYMIPMSMSMALTILVSFEVGARRFQDAKLYGYLGIGLALCISLVCAAILLLFPGQIASIYSQDPEVLALTQRFLVYALFFQLFDAVAAPIQGALRGYKDVRVTFIVALVSYWGIGLPIGYGLSTFTSMGAFGYWIGLSSGLACGAVGLWMRLSYIQRRKFTLTGLS